MEQPVNKEAATYDSKETDELMTEELANRDDYGEESHRGDPSQAYHDYLEDSQNMSGFPKPTNQQELWNRFREWQTNVKKQKDHDEKRRVGREKGRNDPSRGEQHGTMGEGFWAYKNTPYVAPVQSPAFFMAMPSMKLGANDPDQGKMTVVSTTKDILPLEVSATFEIVGMKIKIECNWNSTDRDEVQTLTSVVKFLESRLSDSILKNAQISNFSLENRTATILVSGE